MRILLPFFFMVFATWGVAAEPLFDLKKAADGVYLAVARPQYKINSNAAVIVLDNGVLIVDTHSKPSAAQALMEQIKTVTDKPVRYVVDSHFHWDHYQGNAAYVQSYPHGIEIISSEATRRNILNRGLPRLNAEITRLPAQIRDLKKQLAQTREGSARKDLEENLRQTEQYLAELTSTEAVVPNLTFAKSLSLYGKNRSVQILFMGRGHTDGDVVVYLPKEKILATGDLLHGFTPYMGDGYPYEWIRTLQAIERLDFNQVLPGHGDLMEGKQHLALWLTYMKDLVNQVTEQVTRGATLEETKRNVNLSRYESKMFGFRDYVDGNIEKVYSSISLEE